MHVLYIRVCVCASLHLYSAAGIIALDLYTHYFVLLLLLPSFTACLHLLGSNIISI